jgi:methionine synthase II (cobalamin-independent)
VVFDDLPLLPYLPELPARGPGADMIARSAAILTELPVEIQPSGWRLTAHPGRDLRRARDFLSWDLDALDAAADGYDGALKIQLCGPWTLAASLELPSGHRVVSDHGATRELTDSLADGLKTLLRDLGRRIPRATIVVQLDEPSVPAVLGARVPTPSGYGTVRSVDIAVVRQHLQSVLSVVPVGARVVHCCAADVPVLLIREAGADALSFDLVAVGDSLLDELGEAAEAGLSLWPGVLPSTDSVINLDRIRKPIQRLGQQLGLPTESLAAKIVPTPTCGLAGASRGYARRAMALLHEAGRSFLDESE